MMETKIVQTFYTALYIVIRIITTNVWHPDSNFLCRTYGSDIFKIVYQIVLITSGITFVDYRIHILNIDYPIVNNGQQAEYMLTDAIKGGFYSQFPRISTKISERLDEATIQSWLPSTKTHSTTRRTKIQIVYTNLFIEFNG